uniref:MH2 domain-containing protein n=1 Tax=Rhabditophanes sp. KR3021 TaxID=114890 RepID=A0AC35U907_9BILA
MSSTQERHSIIERLMRISSTSDSSENLNNKYDKSKTHKLFVKRQWNDLNAFLTDNVNEVFQKLKSMEQEIWCKLILMQRNERVMKAYLRFPTININGGYEEFDGLQVGLARFTTPDTVISSTLTSIENLLFQLKEGIYIKIDNTSGDIYRKLLLIHISIV